SRWRLTDETGGLPAVRSVFAPPRETCRWLGGRQHGPAGALVTIGRERPAQAMRSTSPLTRVAADRSSFNVLLPDRSLPGLLEPTAVELRSVSPATRP